MTYVHQQYSMRRRLPQQGRQKNFHEGSRTCYALHKIMGVPTFLLSVLKASADMMAPAFPDAAEIPWAVARKRVGNT